MLNNKIPEVQSPFSLKNRIKSFFKSLKLLFTSLKYAALILNPKFENYFFYDYIQYGMDALRKNPKYILWFLVNPVNVTMGFKVPDSFKNEIYKNVLNQSTFLGEITSRQTSLDRIVLSGNNVHMKYPSEIVTTYEDADIPDPYYTDIPIHVALISMVVTNDALEDTTFSVTDELTEAISEAYAVSIDQTVYSGDGHGKPQGIKTLRDEYQQHGNLVEYNGRITFENLLDFKKKIDSKRFGNIKLYMNSHTGRYLTTIKDNDGKYVVNTPDISALPEYLFGYPIVYNEWIDEIQNDKISYTVPIVAGDLHSAYCFGYRPDISIRRFDDAIHAQLDRVLYLIRIRFGGQVVNSEKLVILSGPVKNVEITQNSLSKSVKFVNMEELRDNYAPEFDKAVSNTEELTIAEELKKRELYQQ